MSKWYATSWGRRFPYLPVTPRTLNFYDDAIVVAHVSRKIHLQLEAVGVAAGRESVIFGHTQDTEQLMREGMDVLHSARHAMAALARASSADELVAKNKRNRLYPLDQFEAGRIKVGKGRWHQVVLKRREGGKIVHWALARKGKSRTLDGVVGGLKLTLGDRLTIENPENLK